MSLELILIQNLEVMEKLIFLCSIIFISILISKFWRHSTIFVSLIIGAIITLSASFHTTADVGFIIIGWWALPWGYFIIYKAYIELLKIENGLSEEVRLLWIIGIFSPLWLIFAILSLILFSPVLILFYSVSPWLKPFLPFAGGIVGSLFFYYFYYYKYIKSKLHSFPETGVISNSGYYLLIFGAFLSLIVLIFEFYTFTLGIGG